MISSVAQQGCQRVVRTGLRTAGLLLLALAAGHASAQFLGPAPTAVVPQPPRLIPEPLPTAAMTLLAGDLCEVQIFGIPQYDYKVRVGEDGSFELPLAGNLAVAGSSIAATQRAIAGRLVSLQLVRDPQVALHVLESPNRFATVTGEVKTPGPVQIYGEKRLLDVLSAAGGLTPFSSPLLTIYRRGSTNPFQIQLPSDAAASGRENILIEPGDNIVVSRLGVVYILGAVHNQGALPLKSNSPLTLIEAMAMAGGVNYEAALKKAYILRVAPEGRREIPFNVAAVEKHRETDQTLESDDIVLIPTSEAKAALKGGAASIATSLLTSLGYLTVQ